MQLLEKMGVEQCWVAAFSEIRDMGAEEFMEKILKGVCRGRQAIDGDTAQVGPQIAEHLGLPNVSYAEELKVEGDSLIVKRQYEDRYHTIKVKMPCLITALSELNKPRYMTPAVLIS